MWTYRHAAPRRIKRVSIWKEEIFVVLGEDLKKWSLWPNVYYGRGSKKIISIYLHRPNDGSKYFFHVSVFLGHLAYDWLHDSLRVQVWALKF